MKPAPVMTVYRPIHMHVPCAQDGQSVQNKWTYIINVRYFVILKTVNNV